MPLKQLAKLIRHIVFSHKNNVWSGNFSSWQQAQAHCLKGYGNEQIIAAVINATRKVVSGEAVYERDSVLFDHIEYSWPLAAAINWAAALYPDNLHVIDFGGALGSSYRQNAVFLQHMAQLKWIVVEQPCFVDIGKKEFATDKLVFASSLADAISLYKPQLIIAPSVLQYLEQPYEWLEHIANSNADIVFFDRTMMSLSGKNQLTVQKVPASIYPASYPCWALNESQFLDVMSVHYELVGHEKYHDIFIAYQLAAKECHYLFKRKTS